MENKWIIPSNVGIERKFLAVNDVSKNNLTSNIAENSENFQNFSNLILLTSFKYTRSYDILEVDPAEVDRLLLMEFI